MSAIKTYVFIDIETTGMPSEENNKTKITELSFVAVKRQHLLDTRIGFAPRVQQKLTLCFNPGRMVHPDGTEITGLCNNLLEHEPYFNLETYSLINKFLNVLTKPVCLIAHNGNGFDYPILRNHFDKLGVSLSDDLICADCFHAFYDIIEGGYKSKNTSSSEEKSTKKETVNDECDFLKDDTLSAKEVNERTPKQSVIKIDNKTPQKIKHKSEVSKARRRFPWSEGEKPKRKYKLKDVYERLLNRTAIDAHRAENDCLLALECSVALAKDFVQWVDNNHCLFSEIKPMTIGVRLGLLFLTGILWGCTNPFIRLGTRGLREVKSNTRHGQAYAEITFLLANWRCLLPFVINQIGSLVYIAVVQRVPLSLAVPGANSLAFAFTAITGAAVGVEEPLNSGSILGIVLIAIGTALCCWDKTN